MTDIARLPAWPSPFWRLAAAQLHSLRQLDGRGSPNMLQIEYNRPRHFHFLTKLTQPTQPNIWTGTCSFASGSIEPSLSYESQGLSIHKTHPRKTISRWTFTAHQISRVIDVIPRFVQTPRRSAVGLPVSTLDFPRAAPCRSKQLHEVHIATEPREGVYGRMDLGAPEGKKRRERRSVYITGLGISFLELSSVESSTRHPSASSGAPSWRNE